VGVPAPSRPSERPAPDPDVEPKSCSTELGHRPWHLASRLAVEERQRVEVVRTPDNERRVVSAVEPTRDLDTENTKEVMSLLETSTAPSG